ncbi:MAG TPA: energy transducer TonB [Cyclobacteriaceae bacterium]|nr:energy transducer TonB [Cyclobacteriaceae bacterium]
MKNKLRIMKAMPPVTDDEIRSHMDFDAVIRMHRLHVEHRTDWLRGFRIAMTLSALAGSAYLFLRQENAPDTPNEEKISPVEIPVEPEPAQEKQDEITTTPLTPKNENKSNAKTLRPDVVQQTYTRAEPTAGYQHLYAYFSRELKYPKAAIKDSVEGTAVVSFIIDEQGNAAGLTIDNSVGPLFDEECLRVIAHMPDWNPALLNGTPTSSRVSLPLTFRISENKGANKGKRGLSKQTYVGAAPKAGYRHLYDYFSAELKYPMEAVKDSVQGTALISFTIDELGKVAKVTVENSLGRLFDEECLRLIAQMPEWKPAQLNGAPIPARISLPLTFRITERTPLKKR